MLQDSKHSNQSATVFHIKEKTDSHGTQMEAKYYCIIFYISTYMAPLEEQTFQLLSQPDSPKEDHGKIISVFVNLCNTSCRTNSSVALQA